jgi:dienelactone hydrolase
MSAPPSGARFEQRPVLITFNEASAFKETYGGPSDLIVLEGFHMRRPDASTRTICVFMHPTATLHLLPFPRALARRGVAVLCCSSRYPHNDSALIMEKVLIDLGRVLRHARADLGYEKVVLIGWSGGGPLTAYYQGQADNPTVAATPAGDPIDLGDLPPADGLIQIAAHLSRATILTEWLDPAIVDERDPTRRAPEFDLYDPDGAAPPYDPAFVAEFRAAQVARNRRITAWVKDTLADLGRRGGPDVERAFVTFGTMADPRWLDPMIEPNERTPGRCYLGDPAQVNNGPAGLARFSTLRSWLSQWSIDDSLGSTERNGPHVAVPTLVVENGADDACPPSHPDRIHTSLGTDKERYRIAGADHYLHQRAHLEQAVDLCVDWMTRKGLLDGVPA